MPKDYDAPDSIKLGKDLLPGDCIRGERGKYSSGIILGIDTLPDFYGEKPHYEAFDLNHGCGGPYSTQLDYDQEFIVINSRREILRYYDIIELSLLRRAADLMDDRKDLNRIQKMAINRLNDKLRNERKNE